VENVKSDERYGDATTAEKLAYFVTGLAIPKSTR
jgi:hypothetical protein